MARATPLSSPSPFPTLVVVAVVVVVLGTSHGQTSIPRRYDGFAYGGAAAWDDSVVVEAFFDPLCPDSRDSWPPLKRAIERFAPRVSLIVHPSPSLLFFRFRALFSGDASYHNNAFLACRALYIAKKLNASSVYPLLELFFKNQENYYNGPTTNMSRAAITEDISKLAVRAVGNSLLADFLSGFQDSATDQAARVSFKYGCSRGVSGAPFFFVNGFVLPDAGSPLDYDTWEGILELLLETQSGRAEL
uniref:Thioredoxin-like fold domain-containing protein n=1 Tax=Ananas comosus var. bracteatus TaxID=296719 RepID=A0A6V7PI72_ANACO|nr:unnamed protein product [Ananas comosus var. bracteatus]